MTFSMDTLANTIIGSLFWLRHNKASCVVKHYNDIHDKLFWIKVTNRLVVN